MQPTDGRPTIKQLFLSGTSSSVGMTMNFTYFKMYKRCRYLCIYLPGILYYRLAKIRNEINWFITKFLPSEPLYKITQFVIPTR